MLCKYPSVYPFPPTTPTFVIMPKAEEILAKYWGYEALRPLQGDIIAAVMAGEDVLVLMPTGGGKSLCFQLPTLMRPGLCLVITPLIALMQDQVAQLKRRGIDAVALHAGMGSKELDIALDRCSYGKVKFLYLSPERLQTELFLARLYKMQVNLIAIDEAHCISAWGHDFRPAYLEIAKLKAHLPKVATIALTATATAEVQVDIRKQAKMETARLFKKSFSKANLHYVVRDTNDKLGELTRILKKIPGSALIYAKTRYGTQRAAAHLEQCGIKANFYHAGLKASERECKQEAWIAGSCRVMVATNAFGMGIDKPDVRLVLHIDLPSTLEAYYQEAGRAGRDGERAYAVMLYNPADIETLHDQLSLSYPTANVLREMYQRLANYYQLAIGSHADANFDFDQEDFAHTYKLHGGQVKSAIQGLERAGLLVYNNQYYQPTLVQITAGRQALYHFQVAHEVEDRLLKALLHIYGSKLLHMPHTISPRRLSKYLDLTLKQLHLQLERIAAHGIITYRQGKRTPQLTFTTPRYDVAKLPLSLGQMQARKARAADKIRSVAHYVRHQHRCREQLLLEYFGEVSYTPCQRCDICIGKKKKLQEPHNCYTKHRDYILGHLAGQRCTVRMLVEGVPPEENEGLLAAINYMLEVRMLRYEDFWLVRVE
jgi:ATP-dependent DNA helicase RecQ